MEFITTNRGGLKLLHDGYSYVKDSNTYADKVVYRCDKKSINCTGRIHLDLNGGLLKELAHLEKHNPDPTAINVLKVKHQIKKSALETRDGPKVVVASATATVSDATAARLPFTRSMKKTCRRVRVIEPDVHLPTSLADFQIPEELKKTLKKEDFLLFDTGAETAPNRIIAFGTQRFFMLLIAALEIFCDGTFKITPTVFEQLYVIHAFDGKMHFPCVYALLPNKKKETYITLLTELKKLSHGRFKPKTVISDFEDGFIRAVNAVFPEAETKDCFFHLCQSIMRHVQKEKPVYSQYKTNDTFATKIKMIAALALLPLEDIYDGFAELSVILPQECDVIYRYFKKTYIGDEDAGIGNGRGRLGATPAEFPPALWNMSKRTLQDLPRTNNFSEGFNNGLVSLAGSYHLNFFKFIGVIQAEQGLQEVDLTQYQAGRPQTPKQTKYIELNNRLKEIINLYNVVNEDPEDDLQIEEFLRRISLNLVL